MKLLSLVLTLALSLSIASAQVAATPSLKDNMKQIGANFKQISSTINDSTKNASNLALVGQMLTSFKAARAQTPDGIAASDVPNYQSLIDQEIQDLTDLQTALQKNDVAAGLAVLQKMSNTKKEGHDKYKQD